MKIGKDLKKIIRQLLSVFHILKKKLYLAYISKINSNFEKKKILLMIPNVDKEGWNYLAVKNYLHYYMVNRLHSFKTEKKLKYHEEVCKNRDFCGIVVPSQ